MIRIFITLVLLFFPFASIAQQTSINIHGTLFDCTAHNGQLVPIFVDPQSASAAAQLGGARVDWVPSFGWRMSLNIPMLNQAPPRSAVMVFFHECGHVALPVGVGTNSPLQEINADCWSVQNMVAGGYIQNMAHFQEAVQYVLQIGGMNGFTQYRIAAMQQCLPPWIQ
ncbi:hypothetical protein O4H48_21200 [Rhodobacteraceae bacterium G21628-S1]|nr:hypothetical protein [Rhodobacteraceae bacterium G21628-S1]